MNYGVGLDVGIASVGWAVVGLTDHDEPCGILGLGSRVFDKAEVPKTGESLASARRGPRGSRRRLRRYKHRIDRIKWLFLSSGLLSKDDLDSLFDGVLEDIYFLRVRALDERVSNCELARILLHLARRRGFKSNRKVEQESMDALFLSMSSFKEIKKKQAKDGSAVDIKESKEKELWRSGVVANRKRMVDNGYRTAGEMFLKDPVFAEHKRNRDGSYLCTVDRKFVLEEASLILDSQMSFGNDLITDDFKKSYLDILASQRNFDDGPGGNSPYGGNQVMKMVRDCTFEKGEKRAPVACYSYEYFNLLQNVNHLRLLMGDDSIPLTDEQRKLIIELAYAKADLCLGDIRKALSLEPDVRFNVRSAKTRKKLAKEGVSDDSVLDEDKVHFNYLKRYHELRIALDKVEKGFISHYSTEMLDEIGRIITYYKDDVNRIREFKKVGFVDNVIDVLLSLDGNKFCHLSLKALRNIIPYLEKGFTYDKACEAAGYDFKGSFIEATMFLPASAPELDDITNPVVRRSVSQTIKVLNAIIREQGKSPVFVNVELARDLSKSFKERSEIKKNNDENCSRNEKIAEYIRQNFGIANPKGKDILKYRLWQEQDGYSLYSRKPILLERLFESGYAEIDHIVPYSDSFDDSYNNKVLCFAYENRDKGDRLPVEYLSDCFDDEAVDKYKVYVNGAVKNFQKRQRLLKLKITDDERKEFKNRNLNDTRYISKLLYNYIDNHLLFTSFADGRKKHVRAVNGSVTAFFRKRLGIRKDRFAGDTHHAVDALVIACVTDGMIQQVSLYSKNKEKRFTADRHGFSGSALANPYFPYPWDNFRAELNARLKDRPEEELGNLRLPFYNGTDLSGIRPIFVSRMPVRKVTGPAHMDTVYSSRHVADGIIVKKKKLCDLKLRNGEIDGYYKPENDRILYNALKSRLLMFDGKSDKAFKEPFYKPKADGSRGPLVRSVMCYEKSGANVLLHGGTGVAKNESMVRVDVFYVEGEGYYLVPVYVSDTVKDKLPNKAIVAHKLYSEWKEMDDKDFVFSLYKNDLIRIRSKRDIVFVANNKIDKLSSRDILVYYNGTNINGGSFEVLTHDNYFRKDGIGVKTLCSLEKYQVDVLGNYHKVYKEARLSFGKGI